MCHWNRRDLVIFSQAFEIFHACKALKHSFYISVCSKSRERTKSTASVKFKISSSDGAPLPLCFHQKTSCSSCSGRPWPEPSLCAGSLSENGHIRSWQEELPSSKLNKQQPVAPSRPLQPVCSLVLPRALCSYPGPNGFLLFFKLEQEMSISNLISLSF